MTRRLMIAAAFAALVAPAGWAQDKPSPLPKTFLLARSWDEAMKEAQIRGVPILFTTALAVWADCQGALFSVLRNSAAVESSLKVVNVVGILDQTHGGQMVTVNGRKEKRCSLLPMMTCEEHFKIADYAFTNGHAGSKGFQQILVNVWNMEGKKPQKPVHNPGGEGYVKMVEEALKKIDGATVGKLEYDAFMAQMDAAQAHQDKGRLSKAIDLLLKAAAHPSPRLAPLADMRVRELNEKGSGRVSEAETAATKDVNKAKSILKEVIQDYSPLDCAQRAAEVLKRLNEKK